MKSKGFGATAWIAVLAMSAGGAILTSLPGMAAPTAGVNVTLSDIGRVATSRVGPAATSDTSHFSPGEQVVLLADDPPGGLGLKAGRCGIVLCCDSSDGSGDILISWDLWTDGKANLSVCFDALNALYPANSAIWVNPNVVAIGHPFKQCGTIRKGFEGCVNFEADDGQFYNVVSPGTLYAALSAGAIHFDDRVQIQGLLNTMPPAPDAVRLCPQFDADIFHPIVSPCPGRQGIPDPFTINLAGNPLQLVPDPSSLGPGYTYDGCTRITLELNFQAELSVKVAPASGVGGTWTGTMTPDVVGPGAVTVHISVHVEHLDIRTLPPGNMQVATVSLSAVPVM